MGLGVLLALGVGADSFISRGIDRDYNFDLGTDKNGKLVVAKVNHAGGLYTLTHKHRTGWDFTNKTNPPVDVNVKIFESATCHVDFKPPGKGCISDLVTVTPKKPENIDAKADNWNGTDCDTQYCPFSIQAKLAADKDYVDVDPDLQIERETLLPDWLRLWLLALAAGLVAAPALQAYITRRRARGVN